MGSSVKNIEVSNVGASISILVLNTVKANAPEYYPLTAIKSISSVYNLGIGRNGIINPTTYPFTDQLEILITFKDEYASSPIKFDLATVTNQAGWTLNLAGLLQAQLDINTWLSAVAPGLGAGATEATLATLATEATLLLLKNNSDLLAASSGTQVINDFASHTVNHESIQVNEDTVFAVLEIDTVDALAAQISTPGNSVGPCVMTAPIGTVYTKIQLTSGQVTIGLV